MYYDYDFSNIRDLYRWFITWVAAGMPPDSNPYPDGFGQPGAQYKDHPLDVIVLLKHAGRAVRNPNIVPLLTDQAEALLGKILEDPYANGTHGPKFLRSLGAVRMLMAGINLADKAEAIKAAEERLDRLRAARNEDTNALANAERDLSTLNADRSRLNAELEELRAQVENKDAEIETANFRTANLRQFLHGVASVLQNEETVDQIMNGQLQMAAPIGHSAQLAVHMND